jgi:hypothetical protein
VGRDGAKGDAGEAGKDGQPGRDGKDGKDGLPGMPGRDGKQGPAGVPGPKGERGERGNAPTVTQDDSRLRSLEAQLASMGAVIARQQQEISQIKAMQEAGDDGGDWASTKLPYQVMPALPMRRPFDLYEKRSDRFKLRGGPVDNSLFSAIGIKTDIAPGAGGVDVDTDIVLTESAYIHIKVVHTPASTTCTLERLTTWPDASTVGTTFTSYYPLYYFVWVTVAPPGTSAISYRESRDYRGLYRLDGSDEQTDLPGASGNSGAGLKYPALYDLYDQTDSGFKIRGVRYNSVPTLMTTTGVFDFVGTANNRLLFQTMGVHRAVKETADGGSAVFDTAIDVSGNADGGDLIYFYQEVTAAGVESIYLERYKGGPTGDHVYQNGGDIATEGRIYIPLWFIETASGVITAIRDMRPMARIDKMAGSA